MGLLDTISAALPDFLPDDPDKRAAARMGLMNFGAAMMAAPTSNFTRALGTGLLNGTQTYQTSYKSALDQKREQMQMDLLKQQIASASRRNDLINGMLGKYTGQGGDDFGAAQQALAAGAKAGDVGPTVTNAARIAQFQPAASNQGASGGVLNNVPVQAIAHDLAFNDGKNIGEWMYKQGVPDMQVSNGYAYNKNELKPGFLPQLNVSQNGQTSMVTIGPDGQPTVSAPRGAVGTYGAYKDTEKRADSRYSLLPLDYADQSGRPIGGSVLNYVDSTTQPGGASSAAQVPDSVLDGLRRVESSGNTFAVNKETKAMGPYQFTPDTVAMLHKQGISFNPFNEQEARQAAKIYLGKLIQQNDGDINKALAQYGGFVKKDPSAYVANVKGNGAPVLQSAAEKKLQTGRADTQVEREKDRPTALSSVQSTISGLDSLAAEARAILSDPSLSRITGFYGRFPNTPGSQASDLAARLETLKSKTAFNSLQAMREASKTGGALGSVSDRENQMLQNNIAALDTTQSPEAFKANLQQIVDYAEGAKSRLASAYKDTYGKDFAPPAPPKQNAWLDLGYPNQQAVVKDAKNTILRNPQSKAEVIKRLEAMGITNHGIR